MNIKKSIYILCTIFFISCGSSVEGEQQSWDRNSESIKEYTRLFPQYETDMTKQYDKAAIAMEAAKQISDEDKKIEAMSAANDLALKGIAGKIMNLQEAMEDVDQVVDKIKDNFTTDEFSQKTNFLLEDADSEIYKAGVALEASFPTTEQAISEFTAVTNDLEDIKSSLDKHYREIQTNRSKTKQKEREATAEKENSKTVVAPIPDISCKKCGGKVKSGKTKCGNCGAPVKK